MKTFPPPKKKKKKWFSWSFTFKPMAKLPRELRKKSGFGSALLLAAPWGHAVKRRSKTEANQNDVKIVKDSARVFFRVRLSSKTNHVFPEITQSKAIFPLVWRNLLSPTTKPLLMPKFRNSTVREHPKPRCSWFKVCKCQDCSRQ